MDVDVVSNAAAMYSRSMDQHRRDRRGDWLSPDAYDALSPEEKREIWLERKRQPRRWHYVHADVSVRAGILILLHSRHPEHVGVADLKKSVGARSAGSVQKRLGELRSARLVHGDNGVGYRLTRTGYAAAVQEIRAAQVLAA